MLNLSWDEITDASRYDSKSLKLAPEGSHTAPLVSAQPGLKPREEGSGDIEGEEVRGQVHCDKPRLYT